MKKKASSQEGARPLHPPSKSVSAMAYNRLYICCCHFVYG